MMILLTVVGGLGGSVLLGRTAVQFVIAPRSEEKTPSSEIWGLSIVLGIGLTGWLSFLWSWSNGRLGFAFSIGLAGLGWLTRLWTIWQSSRQPMQSSTLAVDPHRSNSPIAGPRLVKACQWLIAILVVLAFAQSMLTPQRFWDERAIFAIKAKVLFEDSSINSSALLNPEFVQYHPQYPLMLPLIEQHLYSLMGHTEDRWAKLWFPLLYAGLVLSFSGVCSRRLGAAWGWTCGLLLATVPILMPDEYGFLCAQADAAVACFHGIAVLYLWDGMSCASPKFRLRKALLAGFVASCAAFTKDEGTAFLIIDVLSWTAALVLATLMRAVSGRKSPGASSESHFAMLRFDAFRVLLFTSFAGTMLLPWFSHRRRLPEVTEMHYVGRMSISALYDRLSTLRWSLPHLSSRMFGEWKDWGLQWWIGLAAIVTRPGRAIEQPQLFLILNLFGALAALLVAGMLAPAELEEHLGGSTHRFLMQIVPVVLLLVAAQWAEPAEGFESVGKLPDSTTQSIPREHGTRV